MHKMILNPKSLEEPEIDYTKYPNKKCVCGAMMYFVKNEFGFISCKCECGFTEKIMYHEDFKRNG